MVKAILFGGGNARISDVLETPAPEPTATWNPVSHADFLYVVNDVLDRRGLLLEDQTFRLVKGGARLFGVGILREKSFLPASYAPIPGIENPDELRLALGFANATDKSISARVLGGSHVMVCSNLCMSSEHMICGKHTTNVLRTMRQRFEGILDEIMANHRVETGRVDRWKEMPLPRPDMAEIILEANRAGAIPLKGMQKVMDNYDSPPHQEFDGGTLWTGFNSFTEYGKSRFERNPFTASDESRVITRIFENKDAELISA